MVASRPYNVETDIPYSKPLRRTFSCRNHLRYCVRAHDRTCESDNLGNGQGRFAGTTCHVKHRLSRDDASLFYKRLCERCQHSLNSVTVFLPIWCGLLPRSQRVGVDVTHLFFLFILRRILNSRIWWKD